MNMVMDEIRKLRHIKMLEAEKAEREARNAPPTPPAKPTFITDDGHPICRIENEVVNEMRFCMKIGKATSVENCERCSVGRRVHVTV